MLHLLSFGIFSDASHSLYKFEPSNSHVLVQPSELQLPCSLQLVTSFRKSRLTTTLPLTTESLLLSSEANYGQSHIINRKFL